MQSNKRRSFRSLCLGALAAIAVVCGLSAQYGSRSLAAGVTRLIAPIPPGGAGDILPRLLGERVSRSNGETVVIENRPGANTVIGTELVSRAAPDGSTILINSPPAFTIIPHLRTLNYDPLASFEPICRLVRFPTLIAVSESSPYRTLNDLLAAARSKPGETTLGGIGPASLIHVAFEMLKRAAQADMTFVPYPGPNPAVNALLAGQVTAYFGNFTDVAGYLSSGKLRVLATATRTRIEPLPDVPTVAESGYAGYEIDGWFGLFAPAKTPAPITARLAEWFSAATQDAEVKSKLVSLGLYPDLVCGADFAAFIRKEYDKYGAIIRDTGIKLSE
jgi:tripartite-type tricarboxylate transporter receptor subunit TctC